MMPSRIIDISPADLGVTGQTERAVVRDALWKSAVAGASCAVLLLVVTRTTSPSGLLTDVVISALSAFSVFVSGIRSLSRRAEKRRADIDLAIAVVLDLINIQTAGGAGIETALMTAVSVGDGWVFERIRTELSGAYAARRSYWDVLWALGNTWGSHSLVDMANAGRLTGSHGARIRRSLVSKASSLRAKNLARVEHEAQQRTEQMGVPMVLLFVSFIGFIGYPALAQTVGSL